MVGRYLNGLKFSQLMAVAVMILLLSYGSAFSQGQLAKPVLLKGKVIPSEGTLDNFYVRVRKSGATVVAEDGSFSLLIKALPDTVRFVGAGFFPTTRVIKSESDLERLMVVRVVAEVKELQEVQVSTGYQRARPNEINGVISLIDEKALNQRTGTNILDRLNGQVSGLSLSIGKNSSNPQNRTGIMIRGLGTINGPLDPLIVLDGFIYEGDINNINPFDIESVSVLKDASASSIWGARAGNGVIVLTSKRAKLNQSLNISFNANATIRTLPNLGTLSEMTVEENLEMERFLFDRGFFNSRINSGFFALSPALELFLARRNGRITDAQVESGLNAFRATDVKKEWLDAFYTNALTQQYALNVRTGTAGHAFSLGVAYDRSYDQNYASSDRATLNMSDQINIGSKLSVISSLQLTFANTLSGRPAYGSIKSGGRQGYQSLRDASGNPSNWPVEFRSAYADTAAMGKLLDWGFYPAEDYKHATTSTSRQEILGSAMLRYKVLPYLNVELSYQGQRQLAETEFKADESSYFVRNLVNSNSQINRTTGVVKYNVPRGGYLKDGLTETTSSTGRLQMNFDQNFGPSSVNILAGFEGRATEVSGSGNTFYGYQEDPLGFLPVDNMTYFSHIFTGVALPLGSAATLTRLSSRFVSMYMNGSYAYKGKYRLSGSLRRDGSNVFGASINDKWKPLWSTGLGWSVSKEDFYALDWLPDLRLSVTYGRSGNVDLSKTSTATGSLGTGTLFPLRFVRIRQINNPELRWEELSQVNFKLDFATRRNRVMGSLSLYRKHGTDLYGAYPYDYTAWGGASELTRNVASMESKGVDLDLTSKNINVNLFRWETNLFFSFNKSKTLEYYNLRNNYSALLGGGRTITPLAGMPLYAVAGYKWGGLDAAGNPQGYLNGELSTSYSAMINEGRLNGNNLELIGPAHPVYSGALINTFTVKGFTLAFNMSYRLGYFVRKRSMNFLGVANNGLGHSDYALRWRNPGDEQLTNVPSLVYPFNSLRESFYQESTVNIIPADNIRLDYINLGYHINAEKWRFPFRALDVYLNAANLGIVWKKTNAVHDPDYLDQIGQTKAFTFGIRGNF